MPITNKQIEVPLAGVPCAPANGFTSMATRVDAAPDVIHESDQIQKQAYESMYIVHCGVVPFVTTEP